MALPGAETLVNVAGTFLVATAVLTITLHLAATFVVGDVSIFRALLVAPATALVAVAVGTFVSWPLGLALAVAVDVPAIRWSYEIDRRLTAAVTVGHVAATVLLLASLLGLSQSL